ncbi:hypothetical protein ACVT18_16490 [Klebsiella pneumoniae]
MLTSSSTSMCAAKNKAADEYIAKGFVTSASSPRELAEKLGMDYHASSWQRWNATTAWWRNSTMNDFGRTTALRAQINEGPFYAIQHCTRGAPHHGRRDH